METIRLNPSSWMAHNNLGSDLDDKGETDKAIEQFLEAIRDNPNYAEAYNNLGAALLNKGQTDGNQPVQGSSPSQTGFHRRANKSGKCLGNEK